MTDEETPGVKPRAKSRLRIAIPPKVLAYTGPASMVLAHTGSPQGEVLAYTGSR